jgi:hypothetical protein
VKGSRENEQNNEDDRSHKRGRVAVEFEVNSSILVGGHGE